MLPVDLLPLLDEVPIALAFVIVLGGLGLRWMKQRGEGRKDEWSRMRELLDELREQRDRDKQQIDQRDDLIEQQASHITELRRDLREALRRLAHDPEEIP